MTKDEVREYLTNNEEGKALYSEMTNPLTNKKDEILTEKKNLQTQFRELSETVNGLEGQLNDERNFSNNLIIDNALNKAVTDLNIMPQYQKAVKSMFRSDITLTEVEGKRVCKVDNQDFSDYVTEWGNSEDVKHYRSAPLNKGGGSHGSGAGGTQKSNIANMSTSEILSNLGDFTQ